MKRALLTLTSLLLLAVFGTEAETRDFSFRDEVLHYSIRHSFFPGNIGSMIFYGKDSGDTYRVDATLTASVGSLYSLDCTYGSRFRKDAVLTPVQASREHIEKKYWAKGRYDWTAPGVVRMDVTKSSRAPRNETLQWAGTIRDLLGMIWWLRMQDYGKGTDHSTNALLLDHSPIPVRITSTERKTLRHDGKSVQAIEVTLSHEGKEALSLTLTDDAQRTPLKFSIALPFGTIKGSLKK